MEIPARVSPDWCFRDPWVIYMGVTLIVAMMSACRSRGMVRSDDGEEREARQDQGKHVCFFVFLVVMVLIYVLFIQQWDSLILIYISREIEERLEVIRTVSPTMYWYKGDGRTIILWDAYSEDLLTVIIDSHVRSTVPSKHNTITITSHANYAVLERKLYLYYWKQHISPSLKRWDIRLVRWQQIRKKVRISQPSEDTVPWRYGVCIQANKPQDTPFSTPNCLFDTFRGSLIHKLQLTEVGLCLPLHTHTTESGFFVIPEQIRLLFRSLVSRQPSVA